MNSQNSQIAVLFDGACHLCSYEMAHYVKIADPEKISFVDITKPNFSAEGFGLNAFDVNRYMHVVELSSRKVYKGVDAFCEIWKRLPGRRYKALTSLSENRIVKSLLVPPYFIFAVWVRPYLPKKKHCAIHP